MTYDQIPGWFDFAEFYDRMVAEARDGAVFVEVGCWLGKSAAYMAKAIESSGKRVKLYAVDNFTAGTTHPETNPGDGRYQDKPLLLCFRDNMEACGVLHLIEVIESDSAEAANQFADGSVDFCFIDADHSYEGVKRDIAAWFPKMKVGGVIAGHDRVRVGVARAVADAFLRYETSGPLVWWVRV